jgi:hypothetical protein
MQTISSPISQTLDRDKGQLPEIAYVPLLQKALDGLDISLDEELDRYRHWQENGQTFSYLNPFRSPSRFSANVSSANATSASLQLPKMPLPSMPTADRVAKNVGEERSYSSYQTNPEPQHSNVKSAQPPVSDLANFAEPDLFEQIAETTLEQPNPDPVHPDQEMSEDDLFRTISDEYANDEEFDSDDLAEEYEEYDEYEESDASRFKLFSHWGIAGLCFLLATSALIGYLIIDPASITKLLKPGVPNPAQPATSAAPESSDSSDINLKQTAPTVNPDTLLADPKKNSKLVPFVPLPGKLPQPGQSVKGFTTNTPDRQSVPTISSPGLPTNLSTKKDRPAASKLSVPALPTTKTARLAAPTALPPAISPYRPEAYTPPVEPYIPPVRNTYTPPARETYTPPASVYRSNPEPRPQVAAATSRPRVTSKWKPRTTTPSLSTPSKTAATSNNTPTALPAPSRATTTAITAPPIKDSAPVRYSSPISAASTNTAPEPPAKPANVGYKVVAPTSYLPQAQAVDKDAYVRPSGEVQLGAYQNAKAAQQRADDLRRQGIPVQVEQQ